MTESRYNLRESVVVRVWYDMRDDVGEMRDDVVRYERVVV